MFSSVARFKLKLLSILVLAVLGPVAAVGWAIGRASSRPNHLAAPPPTVVGGALTLLGSNAYISLNASSAASGETRIDDIFGAEYDGIGTGLARDVAWIDSISSGCTLDTTGAPRRSYGIAGDTRCTKSAGTNTLTNIGVYGFAQGGDTNWAGYFNGDAFVDGQLVVDSRVSITGSETFGQGFSIVNADTNRTIANFYGAISQITGTNDATAGNENVIGVHGEAGAVKSAGTNTVNNVGVECAAYSGDTNDCFKSTYGNNEFNLNSGESLFYGTGAPEAALFGNTLNMNTHNITNVGTLSGTAVSVQTLHCTFTTCTGTIALSGTSATVTVFSGATCSCSDTNTTAPLLFGCAVSGTTLTIGTASSTTHTVAYTCE